MSKSKIAHLGKIALFSALISVCAWIVVPSPVPFTMQTFAVFLAAAVLGGKGTAISVMVYIALGVIGIPVFSGGKAGIGVLLGATGGYIIGFLPCGYVAGILCKRTKKRPIAMGISMAVGLLCDYVIGTLWLDIVYLHNFWNAVMTGTVPFVPTDIVKIVLACIIGTKLQKIQQHF